MRNIHFQPSVSSASSAPLRDDNSPLPKLRERTNDPLTEYAQRPGEVTPISDAVAACILSKSGYAVVDGETYLFSSPDSVTILAKNGTGEKVPWVLNRQKADALHILTALGEYVETIPLKGQSIWWSNDTESKRAISDARRLQNHGMQRMQELHKPDTRQAVADAQHNAAEISRVVSTFPVAGSDRNTPADRPQAGNTIAPDREHFQKAERLQGVMQRTDQARAERYVPAPISEEEFLQT